MTARGTHARRRRGTGRLSPRSATLLRRAGWIVQIAAWCFVVAALLSYDAADAPSGAVSVHNAPAANLGGAAGAFVAWGLLQGLGFGAWVLVAGWAVVIRTGITGRSADHPAVRALGVVIAAIAASGFHALVAPAAGSLTESPAGHLGHLVANGLGRHFGALGTFLLLASMLAVGAMVAADTLLLAAGQALIALGRRLRDGRQARLALAGATPLERWRQHPGGTAVADDLEEEDDEAWEEEEEEWEEEEEERKEKEEWEKEE